MSWILLRRHACHRNTWRTGYCECVFAAASGFPTLSDGLFFGGGYGAVQQLGIELFGIVVMATVFALSYLCLWLIGAALHGITTDYEKEKLIPSSP
jgi:Amt family ammonium transporter